MTTGSGILGVEFVEWGLDDSASRAIQRLEKAGFVRLAKVRNKDIDVYSGGDVQVLLNRGGDDGYASTYVSALNGPALVSIGVRVENAYRTWQRAIDAGAWPVGEFIRADLPFPALYGPEDVLIYFVEDVSVAGTSAHTLDVEEVAVNSRLSRVMRFNCFEMRDRATRAVWEDYFSSVLGVRRMSAFEHVFEFVDGVHDRSQEFAFAVPGESAGRFLKMTGRGPIHGIGVLGCEAPDLRRVRRRWAGVFDGLPSRPEIAVPMP